MLSKRSWAKYRFPILLFASLASSCQPQTEDSRQQIIAFGTRVELVTYGEDAEKVREITARIESRYAQVDLDWYPWEKDIVAEPGELRRINLAIAPGNQIEVSSELANLIRRAATIEQLSLGKFNPGIGELIKLWGFDNVLQQNWMPPSADAVDELIATRPGSQQLIWDDNTLRSLSRQTQIDLGGIAKGAILGLTVDLLRDSGVEDAIINIGGDLTVLGNVHGREARIGIQSPVAGNPIAWLNISDGETVVTSGNYERYFEFEGRRYQHIIDPGTGYPVQHTASVTVVHNDPILADAAATALVVAGMAEFDQTCAELGIQQAILIDSTGELRLTADMKRRVNWEL
jgi:thiamine biosynthesis lipoprotein